jgi:hypothetical protein
MRSIFAAALAATLAVTPVLAAETSNAGALSAGKPAGVLMWVGILAAAGAIAAIASTTQGNSSSSTGTSP